MDDIARELATAKSQKHDPALTPDSEIRLTQENDLKELLKKLHGFRSSDSSPLVMLDQSDVLSELEALKRTQTSSHVREEQWCSSIPIVLNSLMFVHGPALTATYAHSAVNTSEPYQLSPSVTILQREAKAQGEDLSSQVQRLQKDLVILDDERTQRKLRSFTERWKSLS